CGPRDLCGVVGAAVVDDDGLPVGHGLGTEAGERFRECRCRVERGNDECQTGDWDHYTASLRACAPSEPRTRSSVRRARASWVRYCRARRATIAETAARHGGFSTARPTRASSWPSVENVVSERSRRRSVGSWSGESTVPKCRWL